MAKVAVVAIGGNSLIKDKEHQTVPDQFATTRETCVHIASMIEQGWDVAETLSFCCEHKMGIDPNGWQTRDDLEFFVFQSDIFESLLQLLDFVETRLHLLPCPVNACVEIHH